MEFKLVYTYDPTYENPYWCNISWITGHGTKESKSYCGFSFENAKERALEGTKATIDRAKVNPAIPEPEVINV